MKSYESKNFRIKRVLEIADMVHISVFTRSDENSVPNVSFILKKDSDFSIQNNVDTIAYVVNYENNNGFVVIGIQNDSYHILGFSGEGNFNPENEVVKENFVSNIENYLAQTNIPSIYPDDILDYQEYYEKPPILKIHMGQWNPWNKYVNIDHPNKPVGCVSIATAYILSHSLNSISLNKHLYKLNDIILKIQQGQNYTNKNSLDFISNEIDLQDIGTIIPYTYEAAVDSMARFLLDLSDELNTDYTSSGSTAYSSDAYQLCKKLNLTIPSGYAYFDIDKVANYIQDDHLIYISGSETSGKTGHAWICDGCICLVHKKDHNIIYKAYIHCDWGWDGSCNGYYCGDIFAAGENKYKPKSFFAVKTKTDNSTSL